MAMRNMLLNSNFTYQGNPYYNWQMDQYVVLQTNGGIGNTNCIRFDYHPSGSTHVLSQSMDLVPGKTYRMSIMAKREGNMSLYLSVAYKNSANQWEHVTSNPFGASNGAAYQEFFTSFAIPTNVASENVWMYVKASNTIAQTTAKAYVDHVQLYGDDGIGDGTYGRTRDWAPVYSSANGIHTRWLWPNALVKYESSTTVNGEKWVYFSRREDGYGWIRATEVGIDPTPSYPALEWVTAIGNANVRNSKNASTALSLGHPHAGSIFKVKDKDTTYTEVLWGKSPYPNGTSAYIYNTELSPASPMSAGFIAKMCAVALSFVGQEGAVAWQYAVGSQTGEAWCQSFLSNMAISAGLVDPANKLMPISAGTVSNTKAMMDWLRTQNRLSESSIQLVNGFPVSGQFPAAIEPPKLGDWLYLLSKHDAELTNLTTSHVEMIVEIDPANRYRVKTCGGDVTVNNQRIVHSRWFNLLAMQPTTAYEYYYVAHGSPNW